MLTCRQIAPFVLLAFIGAAESTWSWLPKSLQGKWSAFRNKSQQDEIITTLSPLQYGYNSHYQYGGSYCQCPYNYGDYSKETVLARPAPYIPSAALYDWYPMTVKPVVAKPWRPTPSIPYYSHPNTWRDYRLVANSITLHNPPPVKPQPEQHKRFHSNFQQSQHQQPVVVAHNGVFILNNNAGSSDVIRVSGSKRLASGTESSLQFSIG